MPTEAGMQVGVAFEAVRQCHRDIRRLIADLDNYMVDSQWVRLWNQDSVTSGVSRAAYASCWMAERLYRLYYNEDEFPGVVQGINIRFFSSDGHLDEPRLIVGRIKYIVPENSSIEVVAKEWDFDEGYRVWCNAQPDDLGQTLSCARAERGIERLIVIGLDLYSVTELEDVTNQLQSVQQHFEAHNQ